MKNTFQQTTKTFFCDIFWIISDDYEKNEDIEQQ
jgi:hypothetical protein